MDNEIRGTVRHILTTFGGSFVTAGYISQDDLSMVAGGVAIVVGILWSILSKRVKS